jgi:hypothetical protein
MQGDEGAAVLQKGLGEARVTREPPGPHGPEI